LKSLLLAALLGYVGVAGLAWLAQDSLMFYPRPAGPRPLPPPGWRIEDVSFTTRDGTVLAGVLVLPPGAHPALVIYFGGNAEEVTEYAPDVADNYGERAVLLVNFRGYGASGGKPGEPALVADGIELFDWARQRADLDGTRIAVHGRSLGTGVAVQMAAARPVRCVILTSPFGSALDVARDIYPWLPVSLLMRHRFDSASHAPRVPAPVLIIAGEADTLVRKRHSERLAAAWTAPVETLWLLGFGHNDLQLDPRYARTIRAFLDARL
jgi:fermentation-respiration switch protein FrsA (DUF1100 family)